MNKIEFPRMGVDGVEYTREYIHQWYLNTFHDAIKKRLKGLEYNSQSKGQKEFVRKLIFNLPLLLTGTPPKLKAFIDSLHVSTQILQPRRFISQTKLTEKGGSKLFPKDCFKQWDMKIIVKTNWWNYPVCLI